MADNFRILWYAGIITSLLTIITKVTLFVLIKNCRKFDEIVLFQMSCARILNSVFENVILYHISGVTNLQMFIIYTVYYHTDLVLLGWMCVFTKNLYDKVVVVFDVKKRRLLVISVCMWIFPLSLAAPVPFLLQLRDKQFYKYYNIALYHVRFFVLVANVFAFVRILLVAFRHGHNNRSCREYVKGAVVGFILVLITSFQVFITDIISYSYDIMKSDTAVYVFCVINSFQVLPIFVIFVLLMRGKRRKFNSTSVRMSTLTSK